MTPFADFLSNLRRARGLRQRDLAEKLGLGASYISALEACRKDPPSLDQLDRLCRALHLTPVECSELKRQAQLSRTRIDIPVEASKEEFVVLHELAAQLGTLTPLQIQMIQMVLQLARESGSAISDAIKMKESAM